MTPRAASFLGMLCLLTGSPGVLLRAAPLDSDPVVMRVGQRQLRRSAIEARLRSVPDYQLRTFGSTDSEAVRGFTETVIAKEALLDAAGEAPELRSRPDVAWALRRTLADVLVASIEEAERQTLTESNLRQAFDARRDEYRSPERLLLWRIVVPRREEALDIIAKVQGRNGVTVWEEIARDSSEDRSNHLRAGNLGFVDPNGQTEWPQLRVDPAIFRAAQAVADGTVVPEPVPLGDRFCVVWRRGSIPAREPSFDQARAELSQTLLLQRRDNAVEGLISKLRTQYLGTHNPGPTEQIPLAPPLHLGPAPDASAPVNPSR